MELAAIGCWIFQSLLPLPSEIGGVLPRYVLVTKPLRRWAPLDSNPTSASEVLKVKTSSRSAYNLQK